MGPLYTNTTLEPQSATRVKFSSPPPPCHDESNPDEAMEKRKPLHYEGLYIM